MRIIVTILAFLVCVSDAWTQEYTWKAVPMDGTRTGTYYAMPDEVDEAIGTISKRVYTAPNGNEFRKRSAVGKVAEVVLDAQPAMLSKKTVIGEASFKMKARGPESELSNLIVDVVIKSAAELKGKPVHMGVLNFGGIRTSFHKGPVLLDDVESMLPFNNHMIYLEHKGSTIRGWIEDMAEYGFQILGGVRVVVENHQVVSIEIAGEPLEDERIYGVVTVDFLLDGGDNLYLQKDALSFDRIKGGILVREPFLQYILKETEAGRPIEYVKDGRVTIR